MHDDPFARAVDRAKAAERADAEAKRRYVQREVTSVVSHGARTAIRIHASVFVAVNILLVVIWATTTPGGYPWFLYPFFGWGIGLVAHYSATSGLMGGRRSRGPRESAPPAYAPPAPVPAPAPVAPRPAAAAPVATSGGSTADEIARLAELHQGGALTDKEFKAAKAKLLG